jgi:hypothetical protein
LGLLDIMADNWDRCSGHEWVTDYATHDWDDIIQAKYVYLLGFGTRLKIDLIKVTSVPYILNFIDIKV